MSKFLVTFSRFVQQDLVLEIEAPTRLRACVLAEGLSQDDATGERKLSGSWVNAGERGAIVLSVVQVRVCSFCDHLPEDHHEQVASCLVQGCVCSRTRGDVAAA